MQTSSVIEVQIVDELTLKSPKYLAKGDSNLLIDCCWVDHSFAKLDDSGSRRGKGSPPLLIGITIAVPKLSACGCWYATLCCSPWSPLPLPCAKIVAGVFESAGTIGTPPVIQGPRCVGSLEVRQGVVAAFQDIVPAREDFNARGRQCWQRS